MDLSKYRKMLAENLIQPMTSYMEGWSDSDFGPEHIQKCEELISSYLCALDAMSEPSDDAIMEQVKNLILALNDLDDETGNSMIETSEREAIWEIVQMSAIDCGLKNASDDITEEWRQW